MDMDRSNLSLKIINKVKSYIEENDYDGLKLYIESEEKRIKKIKKENAEEEYINKLIKELK